MQVRFHCPTEKCVAIIEYQPLEDCGTSMECPRCHVAHPITISEPMRTQQTVDACAICGGKELFVRKDFPRGLGLAVVVVFGGVAIYFFRTSILWAFAVLTGGALFDLVIYAFLGEVTTCYACRAEYRRCAMNSTHEGFDLATSEKY